MKGLWKWLKRNLSNVFSVVGIALTIYFGVFYAPGYLQDMREEKINTINEGLIDNIQELTYNKQNFSIKEVEALIKAKEIKYNISYPYTMDELLIQVSERFLDNKFIPIEQRKELIEMVQEKRSHIKDLPITNKEESKFSIFTMIVAILSVIVSIIGLYSTIQKADRDRENQINEDIEKKEVEIQNSVMSAFSFEIIVKEALEGREFTHNNLSLNIGYDFKVQEGSKEYAVECKYYKAPISAGDLKRLVNMIHSINMDLILVTNTSLTNSALKFIEEYNGRENKSIFVVQGTTKEDIRKQIDKILM